MCAACTVGRCEKYYPLISELRARSLRRFHSGRKLTTAAAGPSVSVRPVGIIGRGKSPRFGPPNGSNAEGKRALEEEISSSTGLADTRYRAEDA